MCLYKEHCLRESWRICLKFLREQPEVESEFRSLQSKVDVYLEDPLVSQLYELVVRTGSFAAAESAIGAAYQKTPELFDEYVEKSVPYEPKWVRLDKTMGPDGNAVGMRLPVVRGGHQMCWDPVGRVIYLLGGWDGHKDLGDFWCYDTANETWTCLSDNTRKEGGPGPRSCHKIALHALRRRLYVLGKYIDTETRASGPFHSELYYYDLDKHIWVLVSDNVQSQGGPGLLYDHQMAIDEENDVIYVFGGRLIANTGPNPNSANSPGSQTSSPAETLYSGLYSFQIRSSRWKLIRSDTDVVVGTPSIKSRIGHSMVFNPLTRQLYIYAGQRHKDYLWYGRSVSAD